jgi:hypothetical protein
MSHRIGRKRRGAFAVLGAGILGEAADPSATDASASGGWRPWLSALPFLMVALGVPLIELVAASSASVPLLIGSFNDDAYYYFEIARNLAAGRGSTFDGIEPTNGYHPLWLLLLTPVFRFASDQLQALLAIKALSSVFWILSVSMVYLVARRVARVPEMSIALVGLVLNRSLWFSGMESTIVLPALLGAILVILREDAYGRGSRAGLWRLGLVLMLVPLARLDAVFFVAAVCLVLLLLRRGTLLVRAVDASIAGLPTAAAIGAYAFVNHALFGSAVPVSGRAKALGEEGGGWSVYADYFERVTPGIWRFDHIRVWWLWAGFVVTAVALLGWRRWRSSRGPSSRVVTQQGLAFFEPVIWALALAKLGQLGYYALTTTWPLGRWYHYYLPILLALSLTVLLAFALDLLSMRRLVAPVIGAGVSALLCIHLVKSYQWRQDMSASLDQSYMTQSVDVAEHLNTVTAADSVFAMGDRAGSLAYQLERRLIQTEGLVGSAAFLDALSSGEVHRYLVEQGVDYVVFSGGERQSSELRPVAGRPDCRSFTEPKFGTEPRFTIVVCDADRIYYSELSSDGPMGGMYGAWRYRPELQSQLSERRPASLARPSD